MSFLLCLRIFFLFFAFCLIGCQTYPSAHSLSETRLPPSAHIHLQLGLHYLKLGEIEKAKQKLFLALRASPQSAEVQQAMGYFFLKNHRVVEVEADFFEVERLFKAAPCLRAFYSRITNDPNKDPSRLSDSVELSRDPFERELVAAI